MPISVACACGKKLSVGDQFAGKRVKCPACQQPLTIPTLEGVSENASAGAKAPGLGKTANADKPRTGSSARTKALAPCSRCNNSFPPDTLVKLRGQMICRECKEEALIEQPSSAENKRQTLMWSVIAGGVGVVIVAGLGIFLLVRMANKPGPKPKATAAEVASAPQPPAPPVDSKPADPKPVAVKNTTDPALANLRHFKHEPKPGDKWSFRLDVTLAPTESKDAMEGNRISGELELVQKEVTADQQLLGLVFRKLDVAKPFTDEDHRGAEAFPKNVVGKGMTLVLGPKKSEPPPEAWPTALPFITNSGDDIKHDDDTKDPAGLAFKKYLTAHANDLLAQAFLFLGRDLLPKELGHPATWEVAAPYLMESGGQGPVTWTLERKPGLAPHLAVIAIKSKSEHAHKGEDGKIKARLKVAGTGNWKYNLDDSMTDSLQYTAKIEEEAVENNTKNAYTLKLALNRQKVDPTEVASADKPKPAAEPATKPEEMKKPDEPKKPGATDPKPPAGGAPKPAEPTKPAAGDKPKPAEPKPPMDANKPPMDKPATEPAKPDAGAPDEQKEKLAQARLKQAKQFLDLDKTDDAIDYCNEILKKWPGTKAAEEAAMILKKLKK
jgi:hypothetical protein